MTDDARSREVVAWRMRRGRYGEGWHYTQTRPVRKISSEDWEVEALVRLQEAESPKPSNADHLAQVDPRYLRHLRQCEDYAVEQGYVSRTDWESESDVGMGGEDG